jgi:hypothetical protein
VTEKEAWTSVTFPTLLLWLQLTSWLLAFAGWLTESRKMRMKFFFIPYYFVAINYASIKGFIRYFRGKQKVTWEKAQRAS